MTDSKSNGAAKLTKVAALREKMLGVNRGSCLPDLVEELAALRSFLLGGTEDKEGMPAGSVSLTRGPRGIRVAIRISPLGLEAHYEFQSWAEIWETLDNDLDLGTVPWQEDWQTRRKRQLAYLQELGG